MKNVPHLKIPLKPFYFRNEDQTFDETKIISYQGAFRAPVDLNLDFGVAFLIFVSDPGNEELQISITNGNDCMYVPVNYDRPITLKLSELEDRDGQLYYMTKMRSDRGAYLPGDEGLLFSVDLNRKTLQIKINKNKN